jgi:hypothetical protein
MPTGSEQEVDPPKGGSFAELLLWHMAHGTRAGGKLGTDGQKWLSKELAHACEVTERQVGSWRSGNELPDSNIDMIIGAFFGNSDCYTDYRDNFRRAFNAATLTRDAARTAFSADKPLGGQFKAGSPSPQRSWQPDPPWYLREDFARLDVHPHTGAPTDRFTLRVSVALPRVYLTIPETADSPRLRVFVRPLEAELLPRQENVQPEPRTVAGRDKECKNVTYAGLWRITNPAGLNENPLTGTALCDMRLLGDGPHGVVLVLRCKDIDLDITIHDPPPDVSGKQIAALRRVLQRMDCAGPEAEYVELARGGLHRGAAS